jgi:hypothetical protein
VFDWSAGWYYHGDWTIDDVRIFHLDPIVPDIKADVEALEFGVLTSGTTSAPRKIHLANAGADLLTIGPIQLSGPGASEFRIEDDPCSNTTMPACDARDLAVGFAPVTFGAHAATLFVPSTDPDTPSLEVALSGTAGFDVTPPRGTVRTHIALAARGFGLKKGTITVGSTPCKVDSWSDTGVGCLLTKLQPPALYSVSVQIEGRKGPVFTMPSVLEIAPPTIDAIVPDHASPGSPIVLHGSFLSTKSDTSKVTFTGPLGGDVRTRPCKISSWTMDNATGATTVTCTLSAKLAPGLYDVAVSNRGLSAKRTSALTAE